MNELKIFENPAFGAVRTIVKDNEPWFVAKDVCMAFGDTNHNRSAGRVDDGDKATVTVTDIMGREQQAIAVNEGGLYALLFAMQPQKANVDGVSDAYPIAVQERIENLRAFKRWITHDVIPDIRRHGMYATPDTVDKLLNDPDTAIIMLQRYKEERDKRLALEAQAEQNKPKVLFADSVAASRQSILIGELAKLLKQNGVQIGQNRLFQELRKDGYLCRGGERYNQPTQRSMEAGWMEIKESTVVQPNGSTRITRTPKITGSGQIYFINRYLGKKEA